jgi:hypothetical protein
VRGGQHCEKYRFRGADLRSVIYSLEHQNIFPQFLLTRGSEDGIYDIKIDGRDEKSDRNNIKSVLG